MIVYYIFCNATPISSNRLISASTLGYFPVCNVECISLSLQYTSNAFGGGNTLLSSMAATI